MRTYKIHAGNHAGQYAVYDSSEEFYEKTKLPQGTLKDWRTCDIATIAPGDWLILDDGLIMQCISFRLWNMRNNPVFPRWFVRFPNGTFCAYGLKNGTIKRETVYGYVSKRDKGSASHKSRNMRKLTSFSTTPDRAVFATYLSMGISVGKAFMMAFPGQKKITNSISSATSKGYQLLMEKDVQSVLRQRLEAFGQKLAEKFDEDRLIKEVESLMESSKKGSDGHRENIKFVMGLVGMNIEKKKKDDIDEVPYEEIRPPQLPK